MEPNETKWTEETSRSFIDYGRYFVPARETQIQIMRDLIPAAEGPFHVLELACGEGLLAEAILRHFPAATVHGYDLSPTMLQQAARRLAEFGERFQTRRFDLAETAWRTPPFTPRAVVSSLTIHHLDGQGKQQLFRDVYAMLAYGGVFVIADIVLPATARATAVAADAWDQVVRRRAVELDGTTDVFDSFANEKWNLFRYPDDPMDKPDTLFDQLTWLAQVGFSSVDVHWMQAGHAIFSGVKDGN